MIRELGAGEMLNLTFDTDGLRRLSNYLLGLYVLDSEKGTVSGGSPEHFPEDSGVAMKQRTEWHQSRHRPGLITAVLSRRSSTLALRGPEACERNITSV
jgi:hypothetical protein